MSMAPEMPLAIAIRDAKTIEIWTEAQKYVEVDRDWIYQISLADPSLLSDWTFDEITGELCFHSTAEVMN